MVTPNKATPYKAEIALFVQNSDEKCAKNRLILQQNEAKIALFDHFSVALFRVTSV